MKEIRIYLADMGSWYCTSSKIENVMECAESQGTVWTLAEFVQQFNDGEEPLCSLLADVTCDVVMKAVLFEDNKFVCEFNKLPNRFVGGENLANNKK